MNDFPGYELAKWLMLGAIAGLGFQLTRFAFYSVLEAVTAKIEEYEALQEIANTHYFPRVRSYPENLKRFATIHNGRVLDVLDLGVEDGYQWYYVHVGYHTGECGSMLIKMKGDVLANMHYSRNRVAQALVDRCEKYVHSVDLVVMLHMFVQRVMNSDVPERQEPETVPSTESED